MGFRPLSSLLLLSLSRRGATAFATGVCASSSSRSCAFTTNMASSDAASGVAEIQAFPLTSGPKALPAVGLGTWKSEPGAVYEAVLEALKSGYKHIDCASNYMNEHEVGRAMKDSGVPRDEIFLTGKLNNPYHRKEHVRPHLMKTLKDLRVDSLDLYLMHWPVAFKHVPFDMDKEGIDAYESDPNDSSNLDDGVSIRETWEAMEALYEEGLVKAIGVSNFNAGLMWDLLTYAKVKPAVVQVESHPYLQQKAFLEFLTKRGIVFEAYSPLGSGDFISDEEPRVLLDPELQRIADKHGCSVANVCTRWGVQRGTVVLPKSVTPARIASNLHSTATLQLDDEDMAAIAKLDRNHHFLRPNDWYQVPLFTP